MNKIPMRFMISLSMMSASLCYAAQGHSTVEAKVSGDAKSAVIALKVLTKPKIVINDAEDTPWQLTLSDVKGISTKELNLGKDKLDKALPGYKVEVSPTGEHWSLNYKLIAFICTKAKDQCYREVHQGSASDAMLISSPKKVGASAKKVAPKEAKAPAKK